MLKKKGWFILLSLVLMLSVVLSGCGGNNVGGKADGGNGGNGGATEKSGSSGGTKELTFMYRGGTDEQKAYSAVVKKFEEDHPGVKVKIVVTAADQYATKIKAAIAGNKVPDVFYFESGDTKAYVHNDILLDLTPYVENNQEIDLNNMWKYGLDLYRYDGTMAGQGPLYGMPKDVGPFALGYNKSMFEKEGIPLPDADKPYTWQEFIDVAQKLTKDTDGDGKLDQFGTGFNVNWVLQSFVWSNGADWIDDSKTKVTIDDPKFAEALQFFADMQNVYKVTPSAEDAQTLDTYQRWMKGQLGFFPVGPWDMSTYETLPFDYDLMPYPAGATGKSATWTGSLGIGVSAKTKFPEESVALVNYLTASREGMEMLVNAKVQIPNMIDMANEWAADTSTKPANKKEFLDVVGEYGRVLPGHYTWTAEWYDLFFTDIQPVLDGKISAADYVKQEQPKMQKLLDKAIEQADKAKAK